MPKIELHKLFKARKKELNNFPAPRFGSMARIILPFLFQYPADIGGIKRHASATALNFVLYPRLETSHFIAGI